MPAVKFLSICGDNQLKTHMPLSSIGIGNVFQYFPKMLRLTC